LKHLITNNDLKQPEIDRIFDRARLLKEKKGVGNIRGRRGTGVFCVPDPRTRLIASIAMRDMGADFYPLTAPGGVLNVTADEGVPMYGASIEHARDLAGFLSRLSDVIFVQAGCRFDNYREAIEDRVTNAFAEYATAPVVNLGSAMWAPVAGLADLFTIREEFHEPKKKKLAVVWTYHPANLGAARANSVINFASRAGLDIRIACPERYDLDPDVLAEAEVNLEKNKGALDVYRTIDEALLGADIVYAFSWTSKEFYGRLEAEKISREKLKDWTIGEKNFRLTSDARFMHTMPIRRNITATDTCIDAPSSVMYDQVENHCHVLKACLLEIFNA